MYQNLTLDTDLFCTKLMNLQSQGNFDSFNLSSLFGLLQNKYPDINNINNDNYIYRVIFIYGRSNCIPHFKEGASKSQVQQLLDSPIFYFDGLYLHNKPNKDNKPQEIYDFITELEGKDHSGYFFENSTSVRRLFLNVSNLLAHPLQRPEQSQFVCTLSAQE